MADQFSYPANNRVKTNQFRRNFILRIYISEWGIGFYEAIPERILEHVQVVGLMSAVPSACNGVYNSDLSATNPKVVGHFNLCRPCFALGAHSGSNGLQGNPVISRRRHAMPVRPLGKGLNVKRIFLRAPARLQSTGFALKTSIYRKEKAGIHRNAPV
ncbi:MAG: hypothetical protein AB1781_05095 [Pseudomonadota bacterium]